ncbi:MAG TPA: UvrB/UvrC motif-containing protein, partial [Bacillota bacterium]|nr:UvrB/UvrC motif-containing protein [Bacillota bacterium]
REGLDLPEVSLVAILDADKEGFLRSAQSLIQTTGRAARNINGGVIMYADNLTRSMEAAISETDRRRTRQQEYNQLHSITPMSIKKKVRDIIEASESVAEENGGKKPLSSAGFKSMSKSEREKVLKALEKDMKAAAKGLEFERAAEIRDLLIELRARP